MCDVAVGFVAEIGRVVAGRCPDIQRVGEDCGEQRQQGEELHAGDVRICVCVLSV